MGAYIDLLKAAQSGDTAAATVLYEQYQNDALYQCCRV